MRLLYKRKRKFQMRELLRNGACFNDSTQDRWISHFEASLIYWVSFRTARTRQWNSVLKIQNNNMKNLCELIHSVSELQGSPLLWYLSWFIIHLILNSQTNPSYNLLIMIYMGILLLTVIKSSKCRLLVKYSCLFSHYHCDDLLWISKSQIHSIKLS